MLHWKQLVCNSFPLIRRHYSAQRFCQRCLKVMICHKDRFLTFSASCSFPRCREATLLIRKKEITTTVQDVNSQLDPVKIKQNIFKYV